MGLGMASAALADDGPTVSYNLGVTNEYVFRGLSQTSGKPGFFAGVDVTAGMFYAGAWTSNVNFGPFDRTDQEVDLYGGFKPTLGALSFDIGVIYYGYIGDFDNLDDYVEGKLAVSFPAGPATIGGAVYYSPEFPFDTGHATYGEVNIAFPVGKASITAAIGHQDLDESKVGLDGYTTWNVGATFPLAEHVSADVRYWDTDGDARDFYGTKSHSPFNAGASFVATLKASF